MDAKRAKRVMEIYLFPREKIKSSSWFMENGLQSCANQARKLTYVQYHTSRVLQFRGLRSAPTELSQTAIAPSLFSPSFFGRMLWCFYDVEGKRKGEEEELGGQTVCDTAGERWPTMSRREEKHWKKTRATKQGNTLKVFFIPKLTAQRTFPGNCFDFDFNVSFKIRRQMPLAKF